MLLLCTCSEQTANGTGCTVMGQCGKSPEVAGLQDLLVSGCTGLCASDEPDGPVQ